MRKLALVLAALAALAGCSPKSNTSVQRPRSTAKLTIIEPAAGEALPSGNVRVRLKLDGGRITKVVTTKVKPNVGHIHLRLDGKTITLLGSLDQTVKDVRKGTHVLEAEFVAADHGPFDPRLLSNVTFSVR